MSARDVLAVQMQKNDADAETVGDYLAALLTALWDEGESFSGKRPFGNSSWEFEIYTALALAGLVEATFDEFGYLDRFDDEAERKANSLIFDAIKAMGRAA